MQSAITAIIVNYCTYDLTRMAVWSLHGHYPELKIWIVDNASPDDSGDKLEALAQELDRVEVVINSRNVHHGPAMDQLARAVETPYFLTFDSDAILYRPGLLEKMLDSITSDTYAVGHLMLLNQNGFNTTDNTGIAYAHPFCSLFHTETYRKFTPFQKDGSPCFHNQRAAQEKGWVIKGFPVQSYVFHFWKGTVDHIGGHRLGWRSKLNQLLHRLGRI